MSYEQKYLKYKQKYLELKNKLQSINTESENKTNVETNTQAQYELTETPVNNMTGGDFYSFLGRNNNMENMIQNQVHNQVQNQVTSENMFLTETPVAQDGGYKLNMDNVAPVTNMPGNPVPDVTSGQMVNNNPADSVKSIADIVVPEPTATPDVNSTLAQPTGDIVPVAATESKNMVMPDEEGLSNVENTTDIENIFKQLGGKRKSKRSKKNLDDSSDIFGSSDSISIDDSHSSSDYSATPPVPSDTNPFEDNSAASLSLSEGSGHSMS